VDEPKNTRMGAFANKYESISRQFASPSSSNSSVARSTLGTVVQPAH
jgi:hypothetical protein